MTIEEEIIAVNAVIHKLDTDIRRLSDERWGKEQARQVLYDRQRDERLRQQIQTLPYAHLPLLGVDMPTVHQQHILDCQGWTKPRGGWTEDGLRAKVLYAEMVKAGEGVSPAQYAEELARIDREREAIISARDADLARLQEQRDALQVQAAVPRTPPE